MAAAVAEPPPSTFALHSQWRWDGRWPHCLELACEAALDIAAGHDGDGDAGDDALSIRPQPPPPPTEPELVCVAVRQLGKSSRLRIYQKYLVPASSAHSRKNPLRDDQRVWCLVCLRHECDNLPTSECWGRPLPSRPDCLPAFMLSRYTSKGKLKDA